MQPRKGPGRAGRTESVPANFHLLYSVLNMISISCIQIDHLLALVTANASEAAVSCAWRGTNFVRIVGCEHGSGCVPLCAHSWCVPWRLGLVQPGRSITKAGHKVSSMDMTGAGINTTDPNTITTWEDYNQPALNFFQSLPEPAPNEKVVLVGHSLGSFTSQILMESFSHKIDFAVFVSASLLASGTPFLQDTPLLALLANPYIVYNYKNGTENAPTSSYYPTSTLQYVFYNGLDSEIFVLGSKLVRPCHGQILAEPVRYTKEKYGQVPAVYIRHAQDHALSSAAQEFMVTHRGPFREVVELDGGHFSFLQRPKEFTQVLVKLARNYTE